MNNSIQEEEIKIGERLVDPNLQLNDLSDSEEQDDQIETNLLPVVVNTPRIYTLSSSDDSSDSGDENDNLPVLASLKSNREIVIEEDLPNVRLPINQCSVGFDLSAKLLGCEDITDETNEKVNTTFEEHKPVPSIDIENDSLDKMDESINPDNSLDYCNATVELGTPLEVSEAKIVQRSQSVHQAQLDYAAKIGFNNPPVIVEAETDDDIVELSTADIIESNPIENNIETSLEILDTQKGDNLETEDDTLIISEKPKNLSPRLTRKKAIRRPSDNGNDTPVTIKINDENINKENNVSSSVDTKLAPVVDEIKEDNDNTQNLSPKLKKPIRISSGRKHSRTKQYEALLSNYDIIDRTEAKAMKPEELTFSISRVFSKFRRAFIAVDEEEEYRKDSDSHPFVQSTTVVNLSIKQTNDGEQMQVITVGPINKNSSSDQNQDDDMIVYVDELPEDYLDRDIDDQGSEYDSDSSAYVDESEGEQDIEDGLDSPDSIMSTKKSYSLAPTSVENETDSQEKYESKEEEDTTGSLVRKSSNLSRGGVSRSFGSSDIGNNGEIKQRRTTVGGPGAKAFDKGAGIFPFHTIDIGNLKKKTLPYEPFLLLTDGYPTNIPSFPSDRRSLIALEIYTTERTFVRGMEIIVMLFKKRIQMNNLMDTKEMDLVFSNIDQILHGNKDILDDIFDRISDWSDEQCVGDIFLNHEDHFSIYSEYAKNYDTSEALIKQKLKKKKDLETLLATCYTNPICVPGLTLASYLITVIQRIPRYILLIRDLIKRTSDSHPDYNNLVKSQEMMEKVAKFINEQLKVSQCAKALEALQTQITGLKAYYTPERTLVHEGDVCLLTSKKTYHCVLFNDLLVFAVKSGVRQSAVELTLEIKTVWVEDLEDFDPQTTKKDAIAIYTPERPYTMYVGLVGEKKLWLKHLKQAITDKLCYKTTTELGTELDIETRKSSYSYKDESVYSGYYFKAKRHGEGTRMWPNQMTYTGNWQDDERNGYGELEYFTGDKYEGEWVDDKQDGKGVYKCKNGDKISGKWKNGMKHGQIEIEYANGDYFKGNCTHDRIEGVGEFKCRNGLHYKGEWKLNLRHGEGTLVTPDILEYSGKFLYNKFHGYGELRYTDGSIYKGEFERGVRYGTGTYTVPGSISYEGQWMYDLKDGRGKMVYENGDVYDGTWMHDMRIGQGVITYNYGGYYRGQWQADLRHGSGMCEMRDGSVYDGEFCNNKMIGTGKMKFKDGTMYTGQWIDNLQNGKGILTKPGGYSCDGNWVSGKQHGQCILKDPVNNYSYEGEWFNGAKEGRGKETKIDETYEGEFVDDLREGGGTEKSSNGTTVYEGKWSRAQKHGRGIRKKQHGVVEHQIWDHGCLIKTNVLLSPREMPAIQRWL